MSARKQSFQVRKSWHGRLTAQADQVTSELLTSLDVDGALGCYDVAGSLVHAEMLARVGLLTGRELSAIRKGLAGIARDLAAGRLKMPVELEDIHMVIEKALIDRIGPVGGKLHTGRSRNDQVAPDLRLWARDAIDELRAANREPSAGVRGPGGQAGPDRHARLHAPSAGPADRWPATPCWPTWRCSSATPTAWPTPRRRINVCPLGSGAVAGTSLPLDRRADGQGCWASPQISRNSIDATSDRDFLAELCFCCAMLAVHLSRWAEDWIIYSTTEFGLVELDDAYCTSSSMMPQKKNADTLELIRGKAASAIGQLAGHAGAAEGPAAGLQPRPPGRQAIRLRDRCGHAAGADGGGGPGGHDEARTPSGSPSRWTAGSWTPPPWPSTWCARVFLSARPTRSSRGLVAKAERAGRTLGGAAAGGAPGRLRQDRPRRLSATWGPRTSCGATPPKAPPACPNSASNLPSGRRC